MNDKLVEKCLLTKEKRKQVFTNDTWCLPYDNILTGYLKAQLIHAIPIIAEEMMRGFERWLIRQAKRDSSMKFQQTKAFELWNRLATLKKDIDIIYSGTTSGKD